MSAAFIFRPFSFGKSIHRIIFQFALALLLALAVSACDAATDAATGESDTTPPTIVSTSPTDGESEVALDAVITVTFSEEMDPDSFSGNVEVKDSSGSIGIAVSGSGSTLTITPDQNLQPNDMHTVYLSDSMTDTAGNLIGFQSSFQFTTGTQTGGGGDTFTVGGTITGLTGSGFVLQLSYSEGQEYLSVSAGSTSFTFLAQLNQGDGYGINIDSQPTGQNCYFTGGESDVINDINMTNARMECYDLDLTQPSVTTKAPAGGDTGVLVNSAVVVTFSEPMNQSSLQNYYNTCSAGFKLYKTNANSICITGNFSFNANGDVMTFTPSSPLEYNTQYGVEVTNSATDIAGNNLNPWLYWDFTTELAYHTVGVYVYDLVGSGLVMRNNGGDDLIIAANAQYDFATQLVDGSAYNVTVLTQPTTPSQTCTVTGPTGNVSTSIWLNVFCVIDQFTVGGTITGLTATGLVLQNNGANNLPLGINAPPFSFPVQDDLSAYAVTILTQPTGLFCSVTGGGNNDGTGNLAGANDTSVAISCEPTYTLSVDVGGKDAASNDLVLQNNGGSDLTVLADGVYPIATELLDGAAFNVTVLTDPTNPNQTCTVGSGLGNILLGDHILYVTCVTNTYAVGGSINGLAGSGLVLQNNGGDNQTHGSPDSSFTFPAQDDGTAYAVTVLTQPNTPNQICTVTGGGTGNVAGGNLTSVVIDCVSIYTVGITVFGLNGTGLVLQNNGGDDLAIAADGADTFATELADLSAYDVTVLTQPSSPEQICTVTGGGNGDGTGNLAGANVTGIAVDCINSVFALYPGFGLDWNDYLIDDGATDMFDATDAVCVNPDCLHGGEIRALEVTGTTSCAGVTAADTLGAFDWQCIPGPATDVLVVSSGLKAGVNLSDLIDWTASPPVWKPNTVNVTGGAFAASANHVWWGNPISQMAYNASIQYLNVAGTIYVVTANLNSDFEIQANGVAVVVRPGFTLGRSTRFWGITITAGGGANHWLEGNFDATGGCAGIYFPATRSVISNVQVMNANNTVCAAQQPAGPAGIYITGNYNKITDVTATASSRGIILTGGANILTNIAVSGTARGVYMEGNSNTIKGLTATNNDVGLWLSNALFNDFQDIAVSGSTGTGIYVYGGLSPNRWDGVRSNNNGQEGILIYNTDTEFFYNVQVSNNVNNGVKIQSTGNWGNVTMAGVTASNNGQAGIYVLDSPGNLILSATTANNGGDGIFYDRPGSQQNSRNSAIGVVSANNGGSGLKFNNTQTGTRIRDVASANNGAYGVNRVSGILASTGILKVGLNATNDCDATSAADCTTLNAGVINAASSANTFVAEAAGDILNPDDNFGGTDSGIQAYDSITDWLGFENQFRGWGLWGTTYPNADTRGRCATLGSCQIWDWSLATGDDGDPGVDGVIGTGADDLPLVLVTSPLIGAVTGNDTYVHTWRDGSTTIEFLLYAIEIMGDGVGNDNLLCESNEDCIFTPNIGSYQGHGTLPGTADATLSTGTLTGIDLYAFPNNGY